LAQSGGCLRSTTYAIAALNLNEKPAVVEVTRMLEKSAEKIRSQRRERQSINRKSGCCVERVLKILQVRRRTTLRLEVALYHPLAMELQDPALRESATKRLSHLGWVGSTALYEQQRFRNCSDGNAGNDLIGQFRKLPCPGRADVNRSTHGQQHWLNGCEHVRVASGHYGKRSLLCADRAPGHRRINVVHAALGEFLRMILGLCRPDRAHVDDDAARLYAVSYSLGEEHLPDNGAVAQHEDDDIRLTCSLGGITSDFRPEVSESMGLIT
jgi:hypothetical protein